MSGQRTWTARGWAALRFRRQPFPADLTKQSPRALSALGGRAAVWIGLLLLAMVVVAHQSGTATWVAILVGVWAAGVGVWMLRSRRVIPVLALDALLVLADGLLVLMARYDHNIDPAVPAIYMMIGYEVFALRPWRPVLVHLALIGASYGGVLWVGVHHFAPFGRWFAVMAIITTMGLFVRWLVASVSGIARAEREARSAAEAAAAELELQSQAKSRFLARMSHELRTPLNVVLGFAELLSEKMCGPLTERQQEYIADITDSAHHLVTLVDEVLDLANIEAGDVRLAAGPVDVRAVIEDSVTMLHDRAAAHQLDLHTDIDENLPGIIADQLKLRQVLVNLVANAITFTPVGGSVAVRAWTAGDQLHVAVEDTGVGVDPEDRERIFEEFAQARGTSGGTGLGLPLSRRFVELHGGSLAYRPRPGGGSIFQFDLPPRPPDSVERDPFLHDEDTDADYSAFTQPGSPANRALIGQIGLRLWLAGALVVLGLGLITPWPTTGRVIAVIVGSVTAVVAAIYGAHLRNLTFRQVEILAYAMIGMISLLTYEVVGFHDLVPLGFGWMTMITFTLWPIRRAVVQMFVIGACHATVLAYLNPPLVAGVWLANMAMLTCNAEIVSWMAASLRGLVVAEQTAHRNAREVQAELLATSRHKSMFVANMSHELRTPLNAVIGFAELIGTGLAGPLNARQREYMRDINIAARQLLAIINDVLDAAKIEAGQLRLELDIIGVRGMLERAVALANPPARAHPVEVDIEVSEGADYLIADRQRIEQVLVQLVSNGVKFTPAGGWVHVSARCTADHEVWFTVTDSGIGIIEEQIPRIFDAFHQGTRLPADHVRGGTGLGLSLAKSIVEMHGGRIWVTSVPDQGSTFTVALPAMASAGRQLETSGGGAT